MLSICIPVHNYDARPLVDELLQQATSLTGPIELLVYDGGSHSEWQATNAPLAERPGVRYRSFEESAGRAQLLNRMAADASHPTLIMLDVDSQPNADYLQNYLDYPPDVPVVVGGRAYAATAPADPALRLHWHYGRRREALRLGRRRPYLHFQSNNFRVGRQFFLDHPFPEMQNYGHEDTLWGQLLAPTSTQIEYIDNPVIHLGLASTDTFIQRQRQAVATLRTLRQQYPTLKTRLTTLADRYPQLSQLAEALPERWLIRYLKRTNNLRALDLLKLKWWIAGQVLATNYS